MTYSQTITDNVKPNPNGNILGGASRKGTAICTLYELEELFGQCHTEGDMEKVTKEWHFETPRGRATIRDYWWNASTEQSIASSDWRACRWLIAFLRRHKITANMNTHSGNIWEEFQQ